MWDYVLAQTEGDIKGWAAIAASFTGSGILAWYLWYRTSVADPKQRETEAKERAEARAAEATIREKERADFREELRIVREVGISERVDFKTVMNTVVNHCENESNQLREMRDSWVLAFEGRLRNIVRSELEGLDPEMVQRVLARKIRQANIQRAKEQRKDQDVDK